MKVGDVVIVTDVNRKGSLRARVDAVGRKYATIGRDKYDLTTGGGAGDYGSHYHAYTLAAWARREAEDALRDAGLYISQTWNRAALARLTDDEIREATEVLKTIAAKLRGKEKTK